jgi:hypothetical protein
MKKPEYLKFHETFINHMREITLAKNADYTGISDNAFSNLVLCEKLGICSTEKGILTRILDKISRLASLTEQEAQVKNESFRDTCIDAANYLILLAGVFEERAQDKKQETLIIK